MAFGEFDEEWAGKWVAVCTSTPHQFSVTGRPFTEEVTWHGPPRDTEQEAQADREEHIDYYKSAIGLMRHACVVVQAPEAPEPEESDIREA